jgi:Protein of unknown function (DUF1573)
MHKAALALFATLLFTPLTYAQQAAWAEKLFGGELTHDFGTVPRGAQLKYTFKMTNIYKVPLEITDVKVQCGCVKGEPSTKILQPNETASFNINMDGRLFNGQKTVRVYVTVGPKFVSTATLTVSANARGDVVFSPNELDFANLQRGQNPTKVIDVEYVGALPDWRVTEIVKTNSAPFDLKVEELPHPPGTPPKKGYRIMATIKADAPSGAFKQDVILKTNDPAGPLLTFHIVGNVQAGLAVSPSPIVVKDLKIGETHTKKVFVRAARPFRIIGIDGQGDGVTVEVPNREDTTQVITVSIAPTKAGDLRKQLLIRTDLDGERTPLIVEASVEP